MDDKKVIASRNEEHQKHDKRSHAKVMVNDLELIHLLPHPPASDRGYNEPEAEAKRD
jgi:hypothetical protein